MTALIKVLKFEKPLVLCSCVITTFFRSLYLQFGKSFCFQIFATFLADVQACAEKFVGLLLYSNQSTTMPNKKTFFCVPNQKPMITLTNAHGNYLRPIEKNLFILLQRKASATTVQNLIALSLTVTPQQQTNDETGLLHHPVQC